VEKVSDFFPIGTDFSEFFTGQAPRKTEGKLTECAFPRIAGYVTRFRPYRPFIFLSITNISIFTPLLFSLPQVFVFAFFGQEAKVHRTVKIRCHGNEVCGSQRDKAKIVAYMVWGNSYKEQPSRINPARLKESYIDVFSSSRGAKPRTPRSKAEYDFATVDFREKLCYPKPPEKAQIRRYVTSKNPGIKYDPW